MENLGGMLMEGEKIRVTPEIVFQVDLNRSYEHLENFITIEEFDFVKNNLYKFPDLMFRNPSLIIIGFIAYKVYKNNKKNLKEFLKKPEFNPLLKENNANTYDILRYMRFFLLHIQY